MTEREAAEAAIIAAYQSGDTSETVARTYGCSQGTVLTILKKHNIPRRFAGHQGGRRPSPDAEAAVIAAYQSGQSTTIVACAFRCSKSHIGNILKKHNIPRRQRRDYGGPGRLRKWPSVQSIPTSIDIAMGHESTGTKGTHRQRIVRIQRLDGLVRLCAAVRLDRHDPHTVEILGSFVVPVAKVSELQQALGKITARVDADD